MGAGRPCPKMQAAEHLLDIQTSTRMVNQPGTLVFGALPADNELELPIFETVLNGITIVGSIVAIRADLHELFELHAASKTHVIREVRPLEQVNESMPTSKPDA